MSEFGLCRVRPSALRFTHDSVSCKFSNGLSLEETFRQFLYDELDVDDMQCLVAMFYNGKWLVVRGNRRLYLYKKLERIGKFTTVEVDKQIFEQKLFHRQYTSKNMGVSIRIRGCSNIENLLNQITNEWRNTQGFPKNAKSRGRRRRPKSRPRTGNPNAVVGYTGQSNTGVAGGHTSRGNNSQGHIQTRRSPTPPPNRNYSGPSLTNANQHISRSYKTTPTPSINRNNSGTSQTNVATVRNIGMQQNTSLAGSHTSGGNNNQDHRQTYRSPTPAGNNNFSGTSRTNSQSSRLPCGCRISSLDNRASTPPMYVPPPRSNDYRIPTPSVNNNSSMMSETIYQQPRTTYDKPEPQKIKRKEKECECCIIL